MRSLVCAAVVLVLFAGVGQAAPKAKKGKTYNGKIVSVDAAKGTVTVEVKGKKGEEAKQMEFTGINDTTTVNAYVKGEKTELTGKDVLKREQFKAGAKLSVVTDAEGKVSEIRFGSPKKPKKTAK